MKVIDEQLHYCFGLPGCGKSSFAAYITKRATKQGRTVVSNFKIDGAYRYMGPQNYPNGSIIILDEAFSVAGSRNWSKNDDIVNWLKQYRHSHYTVYCFSQSLTDLDIKLRDICADFRLIKKFGIRSKLYKVELEYKIDDDGSIGDLSYKMPNLLKQIFSPSFNRRKVYRLFDSYSRDFREASTLVAW